MSTPACYLGKGFWQEGQRTSVLIVWFFLACLFCPQQFSLNATSSECCMITQLGLLEGRLLPLILAFNP